MNLLLPSFARCSLGDHVGWATTLGRPYGISNVTFGIDRRTYAVVYNPLIHHRRSVRRRSHDYAQMGVYFVTIVAQRRACLFGRIVDGEMILNEAGKMIQKWFYALASRFPGILCDAFICMPDHVHFVIIIPKGDSDSVNDGVKGSTLGRMIGWLKTMTTNEYIRGVRELNWPAFHGKLWQRSFHDRIVRNDQELERVRQYIRTNPRR